MSRPFTKKELVRKLESMKNEKENLNHFYIENDRTYLGTDNPENFITSRNYSDSYTDIKFDKVEAHFRNIEKKLIQYINEYKNDIIFGCVAWLTSYKILDALASCKNVQIIVQKEDFLRPDRNFVKESDWKKTLQEKYSHVKFSFERHQLKEPIRDLSILASPEVDSIRCVGNHNSDKSPAFPRMHNKFLIFCRINDDNLEEPKLNYSPEMVWTGSFNLTQNATYSLENAVSFLDKSGNNPFINSFLNEHHQIFCISEKLNWEKDWIEPQFRIGT